MSIFLEEICNYRPEMPGVLYHYCSIETLLNILRNSCIWLSDAEKANDRMELKYFSNQMNVQLLKILESYTKKIDEKQIVLIKQMLRKLLKCICDRSMPIIANSKEYICCFSEEKDLLSQWRAYGNDGKGVALGFNANLFFKLKDLYNFDFTKVVYQDANLRKCIEEYMEEHLRYILENNSYTEENIKDMLFDLGPIIVPIFQAGYAFKYPGFSEENEWRLYYKQTGNYDEISEDEDPFIWNAFHPINSLAENFSYSDLKFRSLENDICSYYELHFEKCKKDIIKEIVLGPKCKIKKRDLLILLRKYGYISAIESKKINIMQSNIPYI